ncbi:very short patch repair endonuclease [Aminivibrio sp.]|uniref:very short patch repair endonuclease n=1 Tax=Aminivibrio sp. TaxID=1872489 RepID=UPI001A37DD6E|nr:very short patch repair endonuclease [Aminivibrio sp.]MBL3539233.1 DNA mismatch endonuclease Vsr [Aminivibrio sp.]
MPDVFDKGTRSAIMSKVRSKYNKSTELKLIEVFRSKGIKGWRRNYPAKGHPDFVFLKERIVVFVDGCFWHGHDCRNTRPKQNEEFWMAKRERNIARDKAVTEMFKARRWTVLRIWECELKKKNSAILNKKLASLWTNYHHQYLRRNTALAD